MARAIWSGTGKVVLRARQHLAAVVAHERALLLVLLRFSDELRDESDLDLPETALNELGITHKEVQMVEKLVEGMTEEVEPERFHDDYREDLMKLIRAKVKAGDVNRVPEPSKEKSPRPTGARIIDLATLLSESVASSQKKDVRKASPASSRAVGARKWNSVKSTGKRHHGDGSHRKSASAPTGVLVVGISEFHNETHHSPTRALTQQ